MEAKEKLLLYKEKVDQELNIFFDEKEKEYSQVSEFSRNFVGSLREFTLRGGKRFRAGLMFYSYKMFGGTNDDEFVKLSTFIELIQSFLLIHDDIFDNADLRRGGNTIHNIYEEEAMGDGSYDRSSFGHVMGILNGNIANQFAFEIIAGAKFQPEMLLRVTELVSIKICDVLFGQVQDYLLPLQKDFTEEEVLKIDIYKTATYTYEIPLLVGAILAGAEQEEKDLLREFAISAGIAFQIRDDILGMFGDLEKLGKPIASDIKEGKKTLLILDVIRNGTYEEQEVINSKLGKSNITNEEIDEVRNVIRDSGALNRSENLCEQYTTKAKEIFSKIERKDNEGWTFINDVVEYMIKRNI